MPQALPFAVAFAASNAAAAAGATVATQATIAATAATVAATVQTTALVVGASYAIAKLTAPAPPRPSDGQIEFKQPLPARFYPYGRCKLSGPVLLLEKSGRDLVKITGFGSREIDAIEHFYFDGTEAELDINGEYVGWNDGSGEDRGRVYTHLGAPNQTYDTNLAAAFPAWTSDHRLRSIPYVFAKLDSGIAETFQHAFPTGEPQFSIVGGVKVYDPRKDTTNGGSGSHRMDDPSTWEFSANQRLVALDWLTWADGYNKAWARIDWATWVPQIEMAADAVPLKAGGTEPRYRIATIAHLDEPKGRTLRRILDAGDQQLYMTPDGLIGSRGGVWEPPTVTLAVETFPEGSFTHGVPMMDRVNEFQLSATLPTHDFTEVDLRTFVNSGDPEHIAGIIRRQPLDLTQVPSNGQAQRLAKIRMAKLNPRWSGQVRTNFAGLDAIGEAVVRLTFDELDQPTDNFNGPFFVNGKIAFLPDKTGITFPVASIDPTAYSWNADTEERDPPPVPEPEEELFLSSSES